MDFATYREAFTAYLRGETLTDAQRNALATPLPSGRRAEVLSIRAVLVHHSLLKGPFLS